MESLHEEWRPVVGFEHSHEVSSLGRVRSIDRIVVFTGRGGCTVRRKAKGKMLKPLKHPHGYRMVSPSGLRHTCIHKIVAEAFIGPRPEGLDINHIDGDKTNNAAANLEYVTRKENMQHAMRIGIWTPSAAHLQKTA